MGAGICLGSFVSGICSGLPKCIFDSLPIVTVGVTAKLPGMEVLSLG